MELPPIVEPAQIVPVFPLQETVFFPRTSLPLHIFEDRYQAMLRDVHSGDGLIVVSLAAGDDFASIGTLGRVQDIEELDDGRSNIRLDGLHRVQMREVACDTAYRQVRIDPRPEHLGSDDPVAIEEAKLDLLATLGILRSIAHQEPSVVLRQDLGFEVVVNAACAGVPIEPEQRQELLAQDSLIERQRVVSRHLSALVDAVSQLGLDEEPDHSRLN